MSAQNTRRTERLGELIVRALGRIFVENVQDPRVAGVTFISCEMTKDLKSARVYYSVIGDESRIHQADRALSHMAGYLQKKIADELKLRYTPVLRFQYDESISRGNRLLSIIAGLHTNHEE